MRHYHCLITTCAKTAVGFLIAVLGFVNPAQARIEPSALNGYAITKLVNGSAFCGVHGLAFDAKDNLYAGSVVGERIYRIDSKTGQVDDVVLPPDGSADDIEFLSDGTMVWTSISQNTVRAQRTSGEVFDLAADLVSVNSIAYNEKQQRLFVAQVFGGDGLWEVDPSGKNAPRNILQDLGGLNGFDVGQDNWIYGPLWFKQQVVKINPDNGALHVIADGFQTPAAANFDSVGNLYVLDTATGEVLLVDTVTGAKKRVAQLNTSIDNLAIDSQDNIYVSNMADNTIHRIRGKSHEVGTYEVETIIARGLSCPRSIVVAQGVANDNTLYLADIFALRAIDTTTGQITDLARSHAAHTPIHYPTAVAANEKYLYVMSSGILQKFSRSEFQLQKEWRDIRQVQAFTAYQNDKLIVLHMGGTRLSLFNAQYEGEPKTLADEIPNGVAISPVINDLIYILAKDKEIPAHGDILQVNVATGETRKVVTGLDRPGGLAINSRGELIVVVGSPGKVLLINPQSGEQHVIAHNIPVGYLYPQRGTQVNGITVDANDNIYVIADRHNEVYRIAPFELKKLFGKP